MFAILGERPPPRNNHGPILGGPWGGLTRGAEALNYIPGPSSDMAGKGLAGDAVNRIPRYRAAAASSGRLTLARPFSITPLTTPALAVPAKGVVFAGGQRDPVLLRANARAEDQFAPRPRANRRDTATTAF